jgi:hypothetical protein
MKRPSARSPVGSGFTRLYGATVPLALSQGQKGVPIFSSVRLWLYQVNIIQPNGLA